MLIFKFNFVLNNSATVFLTVVQLLNCKTWRKLWLLQDNLTQFFLHISELNFLSPFYHLQVRRIGYYVHVFTDMFRRNRSRKKWNGRTIQSHRSTSLAKLSLPGRSMTRGRTNSGVREKEGMCPATPQFTSANVSYSRARIMPLKFQLIRAVHRSLVVVVACNC